MLDDLSELIDNSIRIVLLEATVGKQYPHEELLEAESNEVIRNLIRISRPIDHYSGDRKFELYWDSYIAYSIVDEAYSNGEEDVPDMPNSLFMEFEKSNYLDYLAKATFATSEYPGPYRHWAIYCLNHTINVASQYKPVTRVIG